ncbi:MAG: hypothetical protein Q7S31_04000 [bacterium]|nr:hypothetical protein [bacterium]
MKQLTFGLIWVTAVSLVVTCGLLLVYRTILPPQVPLWYSQPWGQEQLASPYWLWSVPGLIGVMAAVGWWGSKFLAGEKLLAQLWMATAIVVEGILALAAVRIIWLIVF